MSNKTAVVALGGNAITVPGQEDTIANQFANTRASLDGIVELARDGFKLVITHGNGPQVGNALLRVELARGKAPILPLGVLVADTEGGMGYMIEQSLQNRLKKDGIDRPVITIITQMIVDEHDPAVANPTKFIGQFYTEQDARLFEETRGWTMKADANRGWRRVVPSPVPLRAVEAPLIKQLVENGAIVLAGGGGGIPVYIDSKGNLEGMDAVIDKDLGSAVLAAEIGASVLSILTSVDNVALNFGKPNQKVLESCTFTEMKRYYAEGHFPPGSMGPKVAAALKFLENGGDVVAITSFKNARKALNGEAGTRIVRDR
ncbi:carbamate kinase [candidate division GN15 bacterium]|uniref:Carbamate kinase n=1 Tax=candidate division GN15 bacterium TaxID=2072418 RepID=A0A855XC09_9BACT|nr:MAG: carbamate kinase [candidate division GN15 bacterium]